MLETLFFLFESSSWLARPFGETGAHPKTAVLMRNMMMNSSAYAVSHFGVDSIRTPFWMPKTGEIVDDGKCR